MESARLEAARALEAEHRERRLGQLRTLSGALCLVVAVAAADADPGLALHGRGLGLLAAVVAFCVAVAMPLRPTDGPPNRAWLILLGAAAVAIAWLQETGAADIAPAAAVWTLSAITFDRAATAARSESLVAAPHDSDLAARVTPNQLASGFAAAIAVAAAAADVVVRDNGIGDALGTLLLCGVLAATGLFQRRAADGEFRTRLLLAELEDAREAEAAAAATAERARIAGELHDVLAHSLSGAAIQLEGARVLAEREGASPKLGAAVTRAGELVKDGLGSARDAVGALRGTDLPGVAELPSLVTAVRGDLGLDVELQASGDGPDPGAEAGLALYRGVQEALTNAARHAPGAHVTVRVIRDAAAVRVEVTDDGGAQPAGPSPGGGHGLSGMRERLARAGGSADAGPLADGWHVALVVPA